MLTFFLALLLLINLTEFKNENGHLDVPVHYEPNPPYVSSVNSPQFL